MRSKLFGNSLLLVQAKGNSFFSVGAFSLVMLLLLGYNQLSNDPPQVWVEKATRGKIEEDQKTLELNVMLSAAYEEQVIVRLKYEGEARLGTDFRGPIVVVVPAGEIEQKVTLELLPTFYDKKDLAVSIMTAGNAEIMPGEERYFINRTKRQTEDSTPQVDLRSPNNTVTLGDFISSGNGRTGNTLIGDSTGFSLSSGDFNTMVGFRAGTRATSGSQLTLVGYQAGNRVTTSELTAIGYQSGSMNTTGFDNTFVGAQSGRLNRNGGDNTFIGVESGENNTTGYDNTFVGEESGTLNTTGYENTFIGEDAGFSNTTGYKQTFVGNETGISSDVGYRNTAIGSESMSDVDDGHHNTAVGDSAGIDIGDGIYNTMVGAAAGPATEWADYNTFIGAMSGWDNNRTNSTTNANRNTYVGFYTGFTNREGQDNVGMGAFSNFTNTNRSRCTFIGADQTVGNNDVELWGYLAFNTGQYAMAMGQQTDVRATGAITMGYQGEITSGSTYAIGIGYQNSISAGSSIGIGRSIDVDNTLAVGIGDNITLQGDNSIVIGASNTVTGANSVVIGYANNFANNNEAYIGNATTASIGGVVNWTATSDERFKTNVQENVPGLGFINALRPVTYNMDVEAIYKRSGMSLPENLQDAATQKEEKTYTGFLAQEVEKAAKETGYDFSGVDAPQTENDSYGLRYAEFVVPLVKAVQELSKKVEMRDIMITQQASEIEKYKAELSQYKALLSTINARLDALEAGSSSQNNNVYTGGQEEDEE